MKKFPNIEAERARHGMTAAALGVSRKTLYNWCSSGKIPQSALVKMSQVFFKVFDRVLTVRNCSGFGYIHPFPK